MKVFLFSPNNKCIGKLDISDAEEIPQKVEAFIRVNPDIERLSYVEFGPRVWTITSLSPFELQEGVFMERSSALPKDSVSANDLRIRLHLLLHLATFPLLIVALFALLVSLATWLDNGKWAVAETDFVLKKFPEFSSWFKEPKSWLGAHQLVSIVFKLPWAFILPASSFLAAVMLLPTGDFLTRNRRSVPSTKET